MANSIQRHNTRCVRLERFAFSPIYATVPRMDTVISPIKIEERRKIGVCSGDTVRIHQKVIDRGKTRIQIFEGLVIAVKHGKEAGGTFTVRATLSGMAVEKIFPLYTPMIDKIEITRRSKVRRAKLYFIREKATKQVRRQLRNARMMNISTDDFAEPEKETNEDAGNSNDEQKSETNGETASAAQEVLSSEEIKEDVSKEQALQESESEEAKEIESTQAEPEQPPAEEKKEKETVA